MTTALVTGANRGLGLEISRQLGKRGLDVVLGCRNLANAKPAVEQLISEGISAEALEIDVASEQSIKSAFTAFAKTHESLDVLVNNAGILNDFGVTASELPIAILRESFETNFFGAFLTTQHFLPLIKKAASGRIVNMSSDLGSLNATSDPNSPQYDVFAAAYQSSKCALNAMTIQFAKELAGTNIKVNSASPGLSRTDMGGGDAPLSVEQGAATPVWLATLAEDGPSGSFFSATLQSARHKW